MKKELKNKLIFISGVVFAFALLGGVVVVAQAVTNSWTPPTQNFPQANVYPPIDTGPGPQTKDGSLILKGDNKIGAVVKIQTNQSFAVDNSPDAGSFVPSVSSGLGAIINSAKSLLINTKGLVLPRTGTGAPIESPLEGTIYYKTADKKVQLWNGTAWTDLGGSGGDSFWTQTADGIIYGGGNVTITSGRTEEGWYATGIGVTKIEDIEKGNSFLQKALAAEDPNAYPRMEICDRDAKKLECTQSFYPPTVNSGTDGSSRYDHWEDVVYSCPAKSPTGHNYKLFGDQCCDTPDGLSGCIDASETTTKKYKQFKYKTLTIDQSSANNSVLNVANITASGNITLSGGKILGDETKSPFITGYVEGAVGNWSSDKQIVGQLPSGSNSNRCIVFLQGFRDEHCQWWDKCNLYDRDLNYREQIKTNGGSLAACWLDSTGSRNIYGSYAGDDEGDVDGVLRCGYLCW